MKNWTRYKDLIKERPELFTKDELEIITDEKIITEFEKSSGRQIGVIYESPYRFLLVDLVKNARGKLFAYERIIPVRTGAAAVLPVYDGKVLLIKQYRHPGQNWRWEIPRGFGEKNLPAAKNAAKELFEETGVKSATFKKLGKLSPDTGLTSDLVDVYLAEIEKLSTSLFYKEESEIISKIKLFSLSEIQQMISKGELTDSFTLSAIGLWQIHCCQ